MWTTLSRIWTWLTDFIFCYDTHCAISIYVYIYIYVCVCIIFILVSISICMCILCVSINVCECIYIYIYIYVFVCAYASVSIYKYLCLCAYIYMLTKLRLNRFSYNPIKQVSAWLPVGLCIISVKQIIFCGLNPKSASITLIYIIFWITQMGEGFFDFFFLHRRLVCNSCK